MRQTARRARHWVRVDEFDEDEVTVWSRSDVRELRPIVDDAEPATVAVRERAEAEKGNVRSAGSPLALRAPPRLEPADLTSQAMLIEEPVAAPSARFSLDAFAVGPSSRALAPPILPPAPESGLRAVPRVAVRRPVQATAQVRLVAAALRAHVAPLLRHPIAAGWALAAFLAGMALTGVAVALVR